MKRIITVLLLVAVAFSTPALAEDTKNQVVIVDIKKILDNSSATKSIKDQIEKKRKSIQSDIAKKEEKLRKKDADLAQQRSVLDKAVFDKKVKEFKTEVVEAQRGAQNKRAQLEKAYATALKEVEKVVISIVSELSKEKGFSVVLPKSNALYAKKELDISDQVLKTLNKRLSKVKVKLEK